ncbi:MAG: phage Gp37/Gp68 family protein [Acidobacteria bacterium]|nr:phage Gp37/Gp68 family protein [Acidobacteriota bacterium]
MGKTTGIEWTQVTWNPWYGCEKVSPGCAHCYAERDMTRYGKRFELVTRAKPATFELPLHLKEPRLIFTCSWSDFFIPGADAWRDDVWKIIRQCPQHIFQILTKRPERIAGNTPWTPRGAFVSPPLNVWFGVSVENQPMADERIRHLLSVPAVAHFLSVEPLLGPVDLAAVHLGGWTYRNGGKREPQRFNVLEARTVFYDEGDIFWPRIDWVIAGGESGPEARPMHPAWARTIRDQCAAAGVPFFFKQWGEFGPIHIFDAERVLVPGETAGYTACMRRMGKHTAGRVLDGREHSDFPPQAAPFLQVPA